MHTVPAPVRFVRTRWISAALLALTPFGACVCDDNLHDTPGSLAGVVCDEESALPRAGVNIVVLDADGASHEAQTDTAGAWRVAGLASGTAEVTIQGAGTERTVSADVEPNAEGTVHDLACDAVEPPPPPPPPAGSITGCVCDDDVGAWVQGANVYVVADSSAVVVTGTDATGCFVLEGVPLGEQILHVQAGSFYREVAVTISENVVTAIESPETCEPGVIPEDSGAVAGRVCGPDGATWLAGADVSVTRADGSRAQTVTDSDGRYVLAGVPAGSQTVEITKGSFSTARTVTVVAGETTTIPDGDCALDPPDFNIAVITGQWDHVEGVLTDVGIDAARITLYDGQTSPWADELLGDYAVLSQYSMVFFNCGIDDFGFLNDVIVDPVHTANLRQFVADGGSVYASDWAYDVVERTWPDSIDFYGNDAFGGRAQRGEITENIAGTVTDAALAAALGSLSIDMHYPLPEWAAMSAVADGVTVYIRGDAPMFTETLVDVPHTVGFSAGAGRVLYTSFHQEPGINVTQERVLQLLMFEL